MPDPTLNPLTTFVNAGGALCVKHARERLEARQEMQGKIEAAYAQVPGFNIRLFRSFLRVPLHCLATLGVAVAAVAALAVLVWLGAALGFTVPSTWSRYVDAFPIVAAVATLLSLFTNIAVFFERTLRFDFLHHWLPRWGPERILANRVRTATPGVFKVNTERCEDLAAAIATSLQANPEWLFDTLLAPRPGDPNTLANELFVGELFESAMFREFGGRWERFRPLQDFQIAGGPACSAAAINALPVKDWVTEIVGFFQTGGVRLSSGLQDALTVNVTRLRDNYGGYALRLFSFPTPRRALVATSFAALSVLFWAPWTAVRLASLLGHLHVRPTAFSFQLAGLIAASTSLALVAREGRSWFDSARRFVRLRDRFELVQGRLMAFEVYRDQPLARAALAKFGYEFGLLAIPSEELQLGGAVHISLPLLKTGAVWTDVHDLGAFDKDLLFFCERAIRDIARELRRLLSESLHAKGTAFPGVNKLEQLKGEYDPYDIVDGFLFLVGSDACVKDACQNPEADCPFVSLGVCDSTTDRRFRYDRDSRHFVRD